MSATWPHCSEIPTWFSLMRKWPSESVQENRQRKNWWHFGTNNYAAGVAVEALEGFPSVLQSLAVVELDSWFLVSA